MTRHLARDAALLAIGIGIGVTLAGYGAYAQPASKTFVSPNGATELKVLLDKDNLGAADVDVGEMTLPAGLDSGEHAHQSTEIFYVLSGELEHVVNGKSELLKPGMVGFVRPPDKVRHRVPGASPVKTVVIWTPGGEAGRISARWRAK
jgi:quercetin dioxygenase-like cupin family protein